MEKVSHVEVISKEFITPSSKTPRHLRNLKLSLLDQLMPPVYIPLIFFYQAQEDTTEHAMIISQKLKQSLSETLTVFYPLAGKLDRANFTIDCIDSGVKYVEARAHAQLSNIIQDPNTERLKQYLAFSSSDFIDDHVLLAVQINFFDCGGIAIGVCLWHEIGDITSMISFVNSWAAIFRGEVVEIPRPNFDLSDHFPPKDLSGTNISMSMLLVTDEMSITKRVVFDKEALATLRGVAISSGSNDHVKDPTRVELVSAFIWKYFIQEAKLSKKPITNTFGAGQAVNLRKRTFPPNCHENAFGNCVMIPMATIDQENSVPEIHDLVRQLRNTIRAINDEYIRKLPNEDDGYVNDLSNGFDTIFKGKLECCLISSWCRFPVYEVDYGWGKPVWVGTTGLSMQNLTVLMDTRNGDGIEAWIKTSRENIGTLENHFKLFSY